MVTCLEATMRTSVLLNDALPNFHPFLFNPILQSSPVDIESNKDLALVDPAVHRLKVCSCLSQAPPAAKKGREQLHAVAKRHDSMPTGPASKKAVRATEAFEAEQASWPAAEQASRARTPLAQPKELIPLSTAAKSAVGTSVIEPPNASDDASQGEDLREDAEEEHPENDSEVEPEAYGGEAEDGEEEAAEHDEEVDLSQASGPEDRDDDEGSGWEGREIARDRDARVADRCRYNLGQHPSSPPDYSPEAENAAPVWSVQVRGQ